MNTQESYAQTCQEFRAAIARIAGIAGNAITLAQGGGK